MAFSSGRQLDATRCPIDVFLLISVETLARRLHPHLTLMVVPINTPSRIVTLTTINHGPPTFAGENLVVCCKI